MKNNRLELKVDAKLENLSVIAEFIDKAMNQFGIGTEILRVQTAVDEACTNIIKYAYSEKGGLITITCEIKDDDFVLTLMDKGKPFDPSSVPPPDLDAELSERKIGGLGIHMMRKLMDSVSYSFDKEKGNTLVMKKTLTVKK